MSSPRDVVLGHKVTPLLSHLRILNARSRAGTEMVTCGKRWRGSGWLLGKREEWRSDSACPRAPGMSSHGCREV